MSHCEEGWRISEDVTFVVSGNGMLASNHRAKSHVWIDSALMSALIGDLQEGPFRLADRTEFTNYEGLYANPTGQSKAVTSDYIEFQETPDALDYLEGKMIVIRDDAKYAKYFAKKTSLLDTEHLGTFHQRLGVELLLHRRINPEEWWYNQKYNPQSDHLREGLYKSVQFAFIDSYARRCNMSGKSILDFGCGAGLAASCFAASGAQVVGIDPNLELLEKASRDIGTSFTPIHMNLAADDPLSALSDKKFDLIWLADVLLLYFYPPSPDPNSMSPMELLRELGRRLNKNGQLVVLQPHGVFWLAPWLGSDGMPFTALTEYRNRIYSVSPSLAEMSTAIADAGLHIDRIHELTPEEQLETDPLGYNFAREFPLWWAFECQRNADVPE